MVAAMSNVSQGTTLVGGHVPRALSCGGRAPVSPDIVCMAQTLGILNSTGAEVSDPIAQQALQDSLLPYLDLFRIVSSLRRGTSSQGAGAQ